MLQFSMCENLVFECSKLQFLFKTEKEAEKFSKFLHSFSGFLPD